MEDKEWWHTLPLEEFQKRCWRNQLRATLLILGVFYAAILGVLWGTWYWINFC